MSKLRWNAIIMYTAIFSSKMIKNVYKTLSSLPFPKAPTTMAFELAYLNFLHIFKEGSAWRLPW